MKEENKCEAIYGDNQCNADATTSVISNGALYKLCKRCARVARLQVKVNN